MAESVTGEGASAPSPSPRKDPVVLPTMTASDVGRAFRAKVAGVSPVTDTSNAACAWCESTEDVQPRNGEALCIDCRASIDFMNILSTQGEV